MVGPIPFPHVVVQDHLRTATVWTIENVTFVGSAPFLSVSASGVMQRLPPSTNAGTYAHTRRNSRCCPRAPLFHTHSNTSLAYSFSWLLYSHPVGDPMPVTYVHEVPFSTSEPRLMPPRRKVVVCLIQCPHEEPTSSLGGFVCVNPLHSPGSSLYRAR